MGHLSRPLLEEPAEQESEDEDQAEEPAVDPEASVEEESEEQGKKFVIEEVLIRDIAVHADLIPIGGDISRVTFYTGTM